MTLKLSKKEIEKFSRQIILKNIGALGQKKILNSKVLIIGMGGLGCPVAEFLTRSGIGTLGIIDHDIVGASNIHRQSLYDERDLNKLKVKVAQQKLKNINAKNGMIRAMAERNAINAPIQGSAADIIKIAMINIDQEIEKRKLTSKMLLQVHDELIFDMYKSEASEFKTLVVEKMEQAINLAVPLIVDIGEGDNWLEAH